MKTGKARVMSKWIPEDQEIFAEFPQYDSIDEAVKEMGADNALKFLNAKVQTEAMNVERAKYNRSPSKVALRNKAMASITMEEFQTCIGDEAKLNALIERKVAELEKLQPSSKEDND